mgnify:CR=1 FL=1
MKCIVVDKFREYVYWPRICYSPYRKAEVKDDGVIVVNVEREVFNHKYVEEAVLYKLGVVFYDYVIYAMWLMKCLEKAVTVNDIKPLLSKVHVPEPAGKVGDLEKLSLRAKLLLYRLENYKLSRRKHVIVVVKPGNGKDAVRLSKILSGTVVVIGKRKYRSKGVVERLGGKRIARGVYLLPASAVLELKMILEKKNLKDKVEIIRI